MLSFSSEPDKTQTHHVVQFSLVWSATVAGKSVQPAVARKSTFTVMSGDTFSATMDGIEIL